MWRAYLNQPHAFTVGTAAKRKGQHSMAPGRPFNHSCLPPKRPPKQMCALQVTPSAPIAAPTALPQARAELCGARTLW